MSDEAERRRLRRVGMEVKVFRPGEEDAAADYDAPYWDRVPVEKRAAMVWELSLELWQLAHPEYDAHADERRSSRSVARVFRR